MIRVDSLTCGYGRQEVLKGLSFQVRAGEFVGILGPNGSGKSTLLLSLAGVFPYRGGSIRIKGSEVASTPPRQRARVMASVPQRSEISFPFKCLSLVLMGRYPYLSRWGGYGPADHEAAVRAMEETGTLDLAERLITQVSGGEAQRVILARAMAQSTEILLLDEATSNLDAARKVQVFDLLRRKNAAGLTVLCAMHDLNLAALYCRRLLFLKSGGITSDGTIEGTFTDDLLSRIYETDIRISRHPVTGGPQAHFVPGDRR